MIFIRDADGKSLDALVHPYPGQKFSQFVDIYARDMVKNAADSGSPLTGLGYYFSKTVPEGIDDCRADPPPDL